MSIKLFVLWESMKTSLRSEKGQGMVEYALILTFIALACIAATTTLGTNIGTMFNNAATNLTTH